MSERNWVNNHTPQWKHAIKPCKYCGFCPYGQLVEEFPVEHGTMSCKVFGHDCPVFYHAEPFAEEMDVTKEQEVEFVKELEERYR